MATRVRMVLTMNGEPPRKGKDALAYLTAKTAGMHMVFRRRWPVWRKAMAMAQHLEGASLHIFREARGTKNEHSKYWRMLHPQMEVERRPVVGQAAPLDQAILRENPFTRQLTQQPVVTWGGIGTQQQWVVPPVDWAAVQRAVIEGRG